MLKIKNWDEFQHFKDRDPIWIKVYRKLLDDINWHELSGDDAKLLVMLWLLASESGGILPTTKEIAFRFRIPEKSIKSSVSRLSHFLYQDDINLIHDSATISEGYQADSPRALAERQRREETEKETEGGAKRRTQIPAEFYPDETGIRRAEEKACSIAVELQKFTDYHRGKGSTMADWQAAWRTWIGNVKQAPETFKERDARNARKRWEEMTGNRHPDEPTDILRLS